jgi:YVTN family beta-propeller protein
VRHLLNTPHDGRRARPSWRPRVALALLALLCLAVALLVRPTSGNAASLGSPVWSVSNATGGATGVGYSYSFTAATSGNLTAITMTVPAGTSGTPALGTVSWPYNQTPTGQSVALAGNTLTYSFDSKYLASGGSVSVQVTGLTNSSTPGGYTSQITTVGTTGGPPSAPLDTGTTGTVSLTGGTLASPIWSASKTATGATGASYTYTFTTASAATLTSVTMTVPSGTSGTPGVGTISGVPAGGSASLASNTLTYSFSGTAVGAGTAISIQLTGLGNTSTAGSYTSQITTASAGGPVDGGVTAAVSFTGSALTNPIWTVDHAGSGTTGVTYAYSFTAGSSANLTSITMTVPPGTAGTPSLGTVSWPYGQTPSGQTVSLAGNTLTYAFNSQYLASGNSVSVQIGGMTNTSTAGSYASQITTQTASGPNDAGQTAAISISGGTLANPIWATTNSASGATGVAYTYSFKTASAATLTSVTMTVPPGTAGTPGVGAVTGVPSNGTATLASNTLTYSFGAASVAAGTTVSIKLTGLTNTTTTGSYTSQLTTSTSGGPIDSGISAAISITGGTLANPVWTTTNSASGATGVAYTYSFKTASGATLTAISMTVPPGTAGTPAVGTVTGAPTGGTVTLAANTLTYTAGGYVNPGTAVTIKITGLTNTTTAGSYTSQITTSSAGGPVDSGVSAAAAISGGTLANPIWTTTKSASGATGVAYTYSFKAASTANLTSVTMTVPPGTAGTPGVGTVTGVPSGGTASLASNLLTYSFGATAVPAGTSVSIQLTGLTNTTSTGSYSSQLTTNSAGGPIDTGLTAAISITGGTLTNSIWSLSKSSSGATAVAYTYSFTVASSATLTSITMTVPPGTAGTPSLGTVSWPFGQAATGQTVSLAGDTLTYSFDAKYLASGGSVSIELTGLVNTPTAGTYTSQLTTVSAGGPVDSGLSAAISITGGTLASPIWSLSKSASGTTGVAYTYTFTTASGGTLTSVTATVPPGTAGTPAVGTVTGVPAGGTVTLANDTLTYSFGATSVAAGTAVSIQLTGLTNTTTTGSYTSQLTTLSAGGPLDSGLSAAISISGGSLANATWTPSAVAAGASASYTYSFKTASGATLTAISMTVPPGTAGTPAVGTVTGAPTGGTVTLAANTLTYTAGGYVNPGTAVTIKITGLTNTTTAGSYTSQIATKASSGPIDTGTSTVVGITTGNPYVAYVVNGGASTVSPINLGSGSSGATISANASPATVAFTPDGATAYVTGSTGNSLLPIAVSSGAAGTAISLSGCTTPQGVAIAPNGTTAYVACSGNASVVPVTLSSRSVGSAVSVGTAPVAIAIAPNGATAYVASSGSGTLTPIALATNTAGTAISLSGCTTPAAVAVAPGGATAYVACSGNDKVVPVTLGSGTVGSAISAGSAPAALAIAPGGDTLYVADKGSNAVTPISLATGTPGTAISVGQAPEGIAFSPDGTTAFVTNHGDGTVTPIRVATGTAGSTIAVGSGPIGVAFAPDQAPVAWLAVTPGAPGAATHFDASTSTVASGTIVNYAWSFGDGSTASGSSPTVDHVYSAGCAYTVTLTETDTAGTSTAQIFTGQTMSRNGGASAQTTASVPVTRALGFAATPAAINFAVNLNGFDQTITGGLNLDIGSGTATSGWSISATSTLFSTGGPNPRTLPASSVTIQSPPTTNCDAGAACAPATNGVGYPYTLPAGTTAPAATRLYDAAAGTGVCDQTVTPSFSMAVPSGAYAGTYSSTWTFTVASGP